MYHDLPHESKEMRKIKNQKILLLEINHNQRGSHFATTGVKKRKKTYSFEVLFARQFEKKKFLDTPPPTYIRIPSQQIISTPANENLEQ